MLRISLKFHSYKERSMCSSIISKKSISILSLDIAAARFDIVALHAFSTHLRFLNFTVILFAVSEHWVGTFYPCCTTCNFFFDEILAKIIHVQYKKLSNLKIPALGMSVFMVITHGQWSEPQRSPLLKNGPTCQDSVRWFLLLSDSRQ